MARLGRLARVDQERRAVYNAATEFRNLLEQAQRYLQPDGIDRAVGERELWERIEDALERYSPATLQMSVVASPTIRSRAVSVATTDTSGSTNLQST